MSSLEQVQVVGEQTRSLLEKFFGEASPTTVFSEPTTIDDEVIITAAAWERVGGFGYGGGGDQSNNGGGGGGGGGVSEARPVAVIRLTRHGTEITPLIDVTKIGVTVILAAVGVWRALRS